MPLSCSAGLMPQSGLPRFFVIMVYHPLIMRCMHGSMLPVRFGAGAGAGAWAWQAVLPAMGGPP